jgi:hypothetical protein
VGSAWEDCSQKRLGSGSKAATEIIWFFRVPSVWDTAGLARAQDMKKGRTAMLSSPYIKCSDGSPLTGRDGL